MLQPPHIFLTLHYLFVHIYISTTSLSIISFQHHFSSLHLCNFLVLVHANLKFELAEPVCWFCYSIQSACFSCTNGVLVSGLMPQSWATCGSSPWERSSHQGNSHILFQRWLSNAIVGEFFSGANSMHAWWAAKIHDISVAAANAPTEIKLIRGWFPISAGGLAWKIRNYSRI